MGQENKVKSLEPWTAIPLSFFVKNSTKELYMFAIFSTGKNAHDVTYIFVKCRA
jgi:hypothetical protein